MRALANLLNCFTAICFLIAILTGELDLSDTKPPTPDLSNEVVIGVQHDAIERYFQTTEVVINEPIKKVTKTHNYYNLKEEPSIKVQKINPEEKIRNNNKNNFL